MSNPRLIVLSTVGLVTLLSSTLVAGAEPGTSKLSVAAAIGGAQVSASDSNADAIAADTLSLADKFHLLGVEVWAEVSKSEFIDSDRVDRQIGLFAHRRLGSDRLAPFVFGGAGLNVAAPFRDSDIRADQVFIQGGAGLVYALTPRLDITGEYLLGRRWWQGTRGDDYYLMNANLYMPVPQDESYRQVRFGARVKF
jgi:hypothetical protein